MEVERPEENEKWDDLFKVVERIAEYNTATKRRTGRFDYELTEINKELVKAIREARGW